MSQRGFTLFRLGRPEEALPVARTLVERFPDDVFGWSLLGAAVARLGSMEEVSEARLRLEAALTDREAPASVPRALFGPVIVP